MSGPIWPSPDKIPFPPLMTYGFDDQVILPFILKTPKIIPKQFEIGLKINWLVYAKNMHTSIWIRENQIPLSKCKFSEQRSIKRN